MDLADGKQNLLITPSDCGEVGEIGDTCKGPPDIPASASGDGLSTERASEVITNSDSDAAGQEVIREFNNINHDDTDGVSGSQILTGDVSQTTPTEF